MQIQVILLYYMLGKVSELEYRPFIKHKHTETCEKHDYCKNNEKIQTTAIVVFPS